MAIQTLEYSNINIDEMAASIGLKAKHIPILIASFLEESQTILTSLQEAIESKDYPAIQANAHSIKGSSGNLKFDGLYEMAKELEFAATDAKEDFDYQAYLNAIKTGIDTIPA